MTTKNEIKDRLILGDNLEVLKTLKSESVDLIYIDPPFFSNKKYEVVFGDEAEIRSFEDRWEGGVNVYVEWMKERVRELHRVLKQTGSFYLHCDWHASHHLRVMLDEVFGKDNFQNEIIWNYKRWTAGSNRFQRLHDNIYFYTKSDNHIFNTQYEPYGEWLEKDYGYTDEQGKRWRWHTVKGNRYKVYLKDEKQGVKIGDVWSIPPIGSTAKERLGYPTQKPEALLEKIIKASSNKNDVVLDSFCGCGTSLAVAQMLGRHWVGIDISPTAIKLVEKRLNKLGARKDETYITINTPTTDNDLRAFKPFEFQNWVIDELGAKHSKEKVGDMGLDGYFIRDLWHEKAGVQVKQSDSVGRNVVDNFETALKRAKYMKGYIVAFSFSKGAYEEVARIRKEGMDIKLIKVSELLNKKEPIL